MTVTIVRQKFPFGPYRDTDETLVVKMGKSAYIALPGSRQISVSEGLAEKMLGAKQVPCPNVGKEPGYGLFSMNEFKATDTIWESSFPGFMSCSRCGFSSPMGVNPRFAAAFGDGPGGGERHPKTTLWAADKGHALISSVCWDGSQFTLPEEGGVPVSVIWMCGTHLSKKGALNAAKKRFRRAKHFIWGPGIYIIQL